MFNDGTNTYSCAPPERSCAPPLANLISEGRGQVDSVLPPGGSLTLDPLASSGGLSTVLPKMNQSIDRDDHVASVLSIQSLLRQLTHPKVRAAVVNGCFGGHITSSLLPQNLTC